MSNTVICPRCSHENEVTEVLAHFRLSSKRSLTLRSAGRKRLHTCGVVLAARSRAALPCATLRKGLWMLPGKLPPSRRKIKNQWN